MKRAVFYARVSSDLQREAKTIDSQVDALKKQIADAGDILVKEYIDDGWSGAQLDRPAMDELRSDLKKNIFDTIYFHNTDRIARDVTYQTIIIAEVLKAEKQIIINGKDYVHNPENKFTLTVLGAVAELEKAKIVERSKRGKQQKLKAGILMGRGNMFGYNYILKTPTSPGRIEINEKEAAIVRFIFTEYAKGERSMHYISRKLEEMGAVTKSGKKLWEYSTIQFLLKKKRYTGVMYFNTMKTVTEYGNPLLGTKTIKKYALRDKSEWIGIPIPAIISNEVFEKVQERRAHNRKRYRNPKQTQLLSSLVKCGHCNSSFFGYQRYEKWRHADGSQGIRHKYAYRCVGHVRWLGHSKQSGVPRCTSSERAGHILEAQVFTAIEQHMLDPMKLRDCIEIFKTQRPHARMERELQKLEKRLRMYRERKQRITEVYAAGNFPQEEYVTKSRLYDDEMLALTTRKTSILQRIPLFRKTALVDMCIQQYCEATKLRYGKAIDYETKRQFLLDHVERVTYWNDKIAVHGSIPITMKPEHGREAETSKIEFQIKMRTANTEREQT